MTNRGFLSRWLIVAAAALTVGISAVPAYADPVSDAATTLRTAPIYTESGASVYNHAVQIDQAKVSAAFGSTVKVAIFNDGTDLDNAGNAIEAQLGSAAVLAVFAGNDFDADSNLVCGASDLLKTAVASHKSQLQAGNYTDALIAFARAASKAPRKASGCGSSSGNSSGANGFDGTDSSSGGTSVWPWIVGLGVVGAGGVGALSIRKRRRQARELSEAKAKVMSYYDRLANEVNSLNPGTDAGARQAVADASERYNSAGSQMASATTVPQWAAVRRTVLEGLQAAQTARRLLKLPEGPEVPPVDEPRGEQLSAEQQVSIQGQQYTGYPSYTPGAPYYYGGGGGYMGGWYTYPFWETMLIGSMIGGGGWGWGGGYGGGGYGAGYDQGYQAGEHNNDDAGNDSGAGGWGGFGDSGGGGSWGGFGDGGGGGGFGGFGDGGGGGGGSDGGSF